MSQEKRDAWNAHQRQMYRERNAGRPPPLRYRDQIAERRRRAVEFWETEMLVEEIADELGCCKTTAASDLHAMGIETPKGRRRPTIERIEVEITTHFIDDVDSVDTPNAVLGNAWTKGHRLLVPRMRTLTPLEAAKLTEQIRETAETASSESAAAAKLMALLEGRGLSWLWLKADDLSAAAELKRRSNIVARIQACERDRAAEEGRLEGTRKTTEAMLRRREAAT